MSTFDNGFACVRKWAYETGKPVPTDTELNKMAKENYCQNSFQFVKLYEKLYHEDIRKWWVPAMDEHAITREALAKAEQNQKGKPKK